jgi:AraC-like DNA-binding protein
MLHCVAGECPLRYREISPHPALAPWVQCYWELEGLGSGPQIIYPDGRPEIVFHFGDAPASAGEVQPRAMFVAQMKSAVTVRPSGITDVLGIRFKPAGAWALLRFGQAEIAGSIIALDEVCVELGRRVFEKLKECPDRRARVATIESVLLARVPQQKTALDSIANLVLGGTLSVQQAREELGISERQCERMFQSATGIGPKLLHRIGRFRRALAQASSGAPWSRVAADCGYSDQSHLVRDFREFTGAPPTRSGPDLFV